MFVVFTGGCYPALALVSSHCFGLNLFSSGVTKYELKKMMRIKIFNSVVLENVPQVWTSLQFMHLDYTLNTHVWLSLLSQLFFQALYASQGEVTSTVMFASTASLLSVIASILMWRIDRGQANDDDLVVVQYYLNLERNVLAHHPSNLDMEESTMSEEGGHHGTRAVATVPTLNRGGAGMSMSTAGGDLTLDEKLLILHNRGWRRKLSRSLTELSQLTNDLFAKTTCFSK